MKLELKNLAPYLPYGLKVQSATRHITDVSIESDDCDFSINEILAGIAKPILRPISDLSLLVIEEFEKYNGKRNGKANEEIINLFCEENGVDEIIENIDLKSLPYECVEYMFRNHYDFFGLIEQGLAISIHDVELKEIKA